MRACSVPCARLTRGRIEHAVPKVCTKPKLRPSKHGGPRRAAGCVNHSYSRIHYPTILQLAATRPQRALPGSVRRSHSPAAGSHKAASGPLRLQRTVASGSTGLHHRHRTGGKEGAGKHNLRGQVRWADFDALLCEVPEQVAEAAGGVENDGEGEAELHGNGDNRTPASQRPEGGREDRVAQAKRRTDTPSRAAPRARTET